MSIDIRYRILKKFAKRSVKLSDMPAKPVRSARKAFEHAEDLTIAFKNWLSLGLCEWRHHLADPRLSLSNAYQAAVRASVITAKLFDPQVHFPPFPFADALFLSRLVNEQFDERFRKMLQPFSSWKTTPRVTSYFDIGHYDTIITGHYPGDWTTFVTAFCEQQSHQLFSDTNLCYVHIITNSLANNHQAAVPYIETAVRLYSLRRDDQFYSELDPTDGWGHNHDFCTDYRLAAIVKHFFSGKAHLLQGVSTEHLWMM
jgi:hypothetical protein